MVSANALTVLLLIVSVQDKNSGNIEYKESLSPWERCTEQQPESYVAKSVNLPTKEDSDMLCL